MERLRLSDGRKNIIKEEKCATVILPLGRKRRRIRPLRSLFFAFLLVLFAVCVRLAVQRVFFGGQAAAAAVTDFLIRQGIGMPK